MGVLEVIRLAIVGLFFRVYVEELEGINVRMSEDWQALRTEFLKFSLRYQEGLS